MTIDALLGVLFRQSSSAGRVRESGGVVPGVNEATLRAAIDESCAHLFNAAGYKADLFAASFASTHHA